MKNLLTVLLLLALLLYSSLSQDYDSFQSQEDYSPQPSPTQDSSSDSSSQGSNLDESDEEEPQLSEPKAEQEPQYDTLPPKPQPDDPAVVSTPLVGEVIQISNCEQSCNYHGSCQRLWKARPDGSYQEKLLCVCNQRFSGSLCEECAQGYFGPDCEPCLSDEKGRVCSGRGLCNQGKQGTGVCVCTEKHYSSQLGCSAKIESHKEEISFSQGVSLLLIAAVLCILLMYLIERLAWLHWLPASMGATLLGLVVGFTFLGLGKGVSKEVGDVIAFEPRVFFLIILPPIMFEAGFHLEQRAFFRNFWTIVLFAVIGTALSAVALAALLFLVGKMGFTTSLPFIDCFMFGSLIAAVDPIATLGIFKRVSVSNTLYILVLGESMLNDAVSIALFRAAAASTPTPGVWVSSLSLEPFVYFCLLFFGSILLGLLIGVIVALLFKLVSGLQDHSTLEIALFFVASYLPFVIGDSVGLSGILTILFSGMTMSHYAHYSLSPMSQITSSQVFRMSSALSETFCFAYLGLAFPLIQHDFDIPFIFVAFVGLLLSRAIAIFPLASCVNPKRSRKINPVQQVIMWVSGLRGAVALALALSFPSSNKSLIVTTTIVLILMSVLLFGSATYALVSTQAIKRRVLSLQEDTPHSRNKKLLLSPEFARSDINPRTSNRSLNSDTKDGSIRRKRRSILSTLMLFDVQVLQPCLRKRHWLRDNSLTMTFLDRINRWRENEEKEPSEQPSSSASELQDETNIKPEEETRKSPRPVSTSL